MSRLATKRSAEPSKTNSPIKPGSHSRSPVKNTRGASLRSTDSNPLLTNVISETQSAQVLPEPFEKVPIMQKINTHFLLDNGKSYKCLITPPCIEYSIPRENFMFVKNLSLNEVQEYTSCVF